MTSAIVTVAEACSLLLHDSELLDGRELRALTQRLHRELGVSRSTEASDKPTLRGARAWAAFVALAAGRDAVVASSGLGEGARGRFRADATFPGAGDYDVLCLEPLAYLTVIHEAPNIGPELWIADRA